MRPMASCPVKHAPASHAHGRHAMHCSAAGLSQSANCGGGGERAAAPGGAEGGLGGGWSAASSQVSFVKYSKPGTWKSVAGRMGQWPKVVSQCSP